VVQRYVMPVASAISLDGDGFLELEPGRWWSGDRPRSAGELLEGDASFALLAAGGVGKTVTLNGLAEVEQVEVVPAGLLTREQLSPRLQDAASRGGAGYLDGLDQAAAFDARLLPWLGTVLVSEAGRGVRWRLGCRSAAWDSALGQSLQQGLPGFDVWKLLPLDRRSAAELVSGVGYDGERFVEQLIRARLGRLSACVSRLVAVARYWHEHGALPVGGAVQAIDYEIQSLLQESDSQRWQSWPRDRGLRVAKRLGAFTIFSGRSTLTTEPGDRAATLSVADLPSDPEPLEPDRAVEPADYRDILGTSLFDPALSAGVAFRHQTYQEYLAAAYLVDRGVAREQVDALLAVSRSGVLPTARIGVAAWLAALRPELVEPLIGRNAAAFAESAAIAELPSDRARAAVVAGLLEAAAAEELRPDWGLDLAGLRHDGLDYCLVEGLQQGLVSTEQLWWIARLALACLCTGAVPGLLAAAHDRTWFAYGRRAAIVAVIELGDDEQRRALLGVEGDGDVDGEVLAAVIDGLYPRLMTTAELTSVLQPASDGFLGSYRMTLKGLVDRIPSEDLATFGRWFSTVIDDLGQVRSFENVLQQLVGRMWAASEDTDVRTALAGLLHRSAQLGFWHSYEQNATPPWRNRDNDHGRRALATQVVTRGGDDVWFAVVTVGLLVPADLPWLLDRITESGPSQEPLLRCVPYLASNPESAAAADAILAMDPSHPAYAATNGWRGSTRLDDPQFARRRELMAQQREHADRMAERRDRRQTVLQEAIARLDSEPTSWWRVAALLAADEEPSEQTFNHDLMARRHWATLTPEQQAAVLMTGAAYVLSHRPQPQAWCTADSITEGQVLPDWAGMHLMATLQSHLPGTLASFDETIWADWAHTIIAAWHLTEPTSGARLDLIDVAMTAAPEAMVDNALTHLDHLQQAGKDFTLHQIYERIVSATPTRFADALLAGRYVDEHGRSLLQIVAAHGGPVGLDTCRRIADDRDHPLRPAAWTHIANLDPKTAVDHLTSLPVSDPEIPDVAASLDIDGLDTNHLESATQILLDLRPPHADPPLDTGWRFGDDPLRRLRGRALDQLAVHGSVDALERLKAGRHEIDQRVIAAYLQSARTRQAELALAAVAPASLLQLLRRSDARLIRDDQDLQHVILAQLQQLQHDLRHTSAHSEIWLEDRPRSEDDISDWIQRRLKERITRGLTAAARLVDLAGVVGVCAGSGAGRGVVAGAGWPG